MAKAGRRAGPSGSRPRGTTRRRLVAAAIETLKREGFSGASARAIAETGGFAQGLVFYHFGSVNELLLAALDETSDRRMARYRAAVQDAGTMPEILAVAGAIYREDLESGHIKVLAELIAGASSAPELGPAITARIEPWVAFAQETAERVASAMGLSGVVPAGDVAFGLVALYLGMELLTTLDGDRARAERLFRLAEQFATLLGAAASAGGRLDPSPRTRDAGS